MSCFRCRKPIHDTYREPYDYDKIAKITADQPEAAHIEIWIQDETSVGQKGKVVAMWAEKGSSPRAVVHGGFKSAFLFGAFCPEHGYRIGLPAPGIWREAFNSDTYDGFPDLSAAGNCGHVEAGGPPLDGFPQSAGIVIPANGAVAFIR